jgi:DNA-binding protein H-NS
MATKKSGPTLAALNAQIAALQAQADALRKKEVAEVVAKIKDAIAHYGLTAADLGLATGARKNAKLPAAGGDKPASKQRKKKAGPKPSARTVKFKDDNGNTWGGMGKRPAWFKAALASGKTPEELLAKS